ncbi:hypothetical protein [Marinomonas lutimaris]|uniref:hypothetical protein n=1 Tax=Marinomonas lutimaris TaxID=2846746 RepID=UPI001CA54D3C|nr:hypothetical protein [Marinomonas lutimaris]
MKNPKGQACTLGVDLSKTSFQLHGLDSHRQTVIRKNLSRSKLLPCIANLPPCVIGIEACGGALYWCRQF